MMVTEAMTGNQAHTLTVSEHDTQNFDNPIKRKKLFFNKVFILLSD